MTELKILTQQPRDDNGRWKFEHQAFGVYVDGGQYTTEEGDEAVRAIARTFRHESATAEEAEDYLNERECAPNAYWGWVDGDFVYWPIEEEG